MTEHKSFYGGLNTISSLCNRAKAASDVLAWTGEEEMSASLVYEMNTVISKDLEEVQRIVDNIRKNE